MKIKKKAKSHKKSKLSPLVHILLIDPLDKLVVKKDSSLQLALTLKKQKRKVSVCFVNDLYLLNDPETFPLDVWDFEGSLDKSTSMITAFELKRKRQVLIGGKNPQIIMHMRLDPPFDKKYLQVLWLLRNFERLGVKVLNSASGISLYNEKLLAYFHSRHQIPTFVGHSVEQLGQYLQSLMQEGYREVIMKPLDLFQGLGVEKHLLEGKGNREKIQKAFAERINESHTPLVVQPFLKEIYQGEVRSVFFAKEHIGSILKVPQAGNFLANVAQGSSYAEVELNSVQMKECQRLANELFKLGVWWIAFDIIGNHISEVNITCPGLLVELSKSSGKNLALPIIELIEKNCN